MNNKKAPVSLIRLGIQTRMSRTILRKSLGSLHYKYYNYLCQDVC